MMMMMMMVVVVVVVVMVMMVMKKGMFKAPSPTTVSHVPYVQPNDGRDGK